MDHAATTPVDARVLDAMLPYFSRSFGNPSSIHGWGQVAKRALDEAREKAAGVLGCRFGEVVFTSGGTESVNAAVVGAALALRETGNHIITDAVEHHAVLNACRFLEGLGFEVTYLPVDGHGMVDPNAVAGAVTNRTTLVSVMMANNEVGTIEPLEEIVRGVKELRVKLNREVLVHTDAVQAPGFLDLDVARLGVDMLSLSSHKFYGPKGAGALYLRRGTPFQPTALGGEQERGRRGGTENIPAIVGMAVALEIATAEREYRARWCQRLRDRLITGVLEKVEGARLNGHPTLRLGNNAHFAFQGVEGETLLTGLDMAGIAASAGSACSAGSTEVSHVLLAMGLSEGLARGGIRFSLGSENTEEEVDRVIDTLCQLTGRLRVLSSMDDSR
jgi:cysteine desulfurase